MSLHDRVSLSDEIVGQGVRVSQEDVPYFSEPSHSTIYLFFVLEYTSAIDCFYELANFLALSLFTLTVQLIYSRFEWKVGLKS